MVDHARDDVKIGPSFCTTMARAAKCTYVSGKLGATLTSTLDYDYVLCQ